MTALRALPPTGWASHALGLSRHSHSSAGPFSTRTASRLRRRRPLCLWRRCPSIYASMCSTCSPFRANRARRASAAAAMARNAPNDLGRCVCAHLTRVRRWRCRRVRVEDVATQQPRLSRRRPCFDQHAASARQAVHPADVSCACDAFAASLRRAARPWLRRRMPSGFARSARSDTSCRWSPYSAHEGTSIPCCKTCGSLADSYRACASWFVKSPTIAQHRWCQQSSCRRREPS